MARSHPAGEHALEGAEHVAGGLHVSELDRELVLLTWSPAEGGALVEPPEAVYGAIDDVLRDCGAAPLLERVFGSATAASSVARGRARALQGRAGWEVPPTFVEGAPLDGEGLSGLHLLAARGAVRRTHADDPYGRVAELEHARVLALSDVARPLAGEPARGPLDEAGLAIDRADDRLRTDGFAFADVGRTWFYLRDILAWYGGFNGVRNRAFERLGLLGPGARAGVPASTAIGGRPARGGWCALDLLAFRGRPGHPFRIERLHNRLQNEATDYGSAFARGLAVTMGDERYVFVSGTAAIDDRGASLHGGDFEAQLAGTVDTVGALLEDAGAALGDIRQATAFLKRAEDGAAYRRYIARSPLGDVPIVAMVADVCRPELLFELDATAVVRTRRP